MLSALHMFVQVSMFRASIAVLIASIALVAGVPVALTANQDVDALLQQLLSRVGKVEANLKAANLKVEDALKAVHEKEADLDADDDEEADLEEAVDDEETDLEAVDDDEEDVDEERKPPTKKVDGKKRQVHRKTETGPKTKKSGGAGKTKNRLKKAPKKEGALSEV